MSVLKGKDAVFGIAPIQDLVRLSDPVFGQDKATTA